MHERMVNVLNFTENAQKMHRKQPEFPENILNLVQNSHRNYTEIILKILHGNYTEITSEYVWNYTEIVQNASGIHPEYIKDAILCDFYYYVCKIYASYTKLISHYALININIGHYSLVTNTNSIRILMNKIFFWERNFNKNLVLSNKKKFFVLSILLILNLYPHKIYVNLQL